MLLTTEGGTVPTREAFKSPFPANKGRPNNVACWLDIGHVRNVRYTISLDGSFIYLFNGIIVLHEIVAPFILKVHAWDVDAGKFFSHFCYQGPTFSFCQS